MSNYGNIEHVIVVFNKEINDNEFGISKAKDLYFGNNLKSFKKLLRYRNVKHFLRFKSIDFEDSDLIEILDIINEFVNGMPLEISESHAFYNQEVKKKCYNELFKYEVNHKNNRFIHEILNIFEFAIENNKNIYFFF